MTESACLDGTLLRTEDDKKQLNLMAVNTAKWREAEDGELKQTLATLYNGKYKDDEAEKFEGVDTASEYFKELNSAVLIATLKVKYNEAKERGEKEMEGLVYEFLTEEVVRATREEDMLKVMKNMLKKGFSLELVKEVTELPMTRLQELQKKL